MTTSMQREPRIASTDGHTATVETDLHEAVDNFGETYTTADTRYRWSCTCSPSARGRWVTRRWQAVQGAATHARRSR